MPFKDRQKVRNEPDFNKEDYEQDFNKEDYFRRLSSVIRQ